MAGIVAHRRDEVYGDPGVHALSVTYFESLKNAPLAHRICMDMLTARAPLDDRAKFVCLSVIADYIRNSYVEEADDAAQEEVHSFLTRYMSVQLAPRKIVRMADVHVRSLAAEIFARVCLVDYPARWPDFFTQLVGVVTLGAKGVDHFLRTLSVVSRLITGRPIPEEVFDRHVVFINHLQETDFDEVLEAWCDVLADNVVDNTVKKECMSVMCEYMGLVDAERFSQHRVMSRLMAELEDADTRTNALACFHELLKALHMNVREHREFVGRLFQQLVTQDLARPSDALSVTGDTFTVRMGAMLTVVGNHLLELSEMSRGKDGDKETEHLNKYYANLETFFPYIVSFLDSKDIKISASVIPFFVSYTNCIKKRKKLALEEYNHFIQVLGIVLSRMKLKPTYIFEEHTNASKENAFDKYRGTLVGLFEEIAKVKRKVVFKGVYQVILKHLSRKDWSQEAFYVAEYPVFLVNLLCVSYKPETQDRTVKATRTLIRALLNSNVVTHPHRAVSLQFFKAVGKNVAFFAGEPRYIPTVLAAFYKHGLENQSYRVRCVCAEQFLALVKGLSYLLNDSFVDIIKAVQRAMITPDTFSEGPSLGGFSRAAQLCLCEVTGIAVCKGKFHKQNKRHFLAEILVPAMHKYHESCNAWATSRDQDGCAVKIGHAFDVVASVARPFDHAAATASGCDDVFVDTVTILDRCAMTQLVRPDVHLSMARLIGQMVVTLDDKFMSFVPKMMMGMFHCKTEANVFEITHVFINMVRKYKRRMFSYFKYEFPWICFNIYDSFALTTIQNLVQEKQKAKLVERQRLFLTFLTVLDENAMFVEIFSGLDEKMCAKLVAMITASSLENGVRGECRIRGFALLTRIVDKWAVTPKDAHAKPFVRFVFNYIIKACFSAMRDAIVLLDGWFQNYLEVFGLCSALIFRMYRRRGDEMLAWLVQDYLPQLQVAPHLTDELIEVLVGDPMMTLEDYLKSFFFEAEGINIPPLHPFIPVSNISHAITFPNN